MYHRQVIAKNGMQFQNNHGHRPFSLASICLGIVVVFGLLLLWIAD